MGQVPTPPDLVRSGTEWGLRIATMLAGEARVRVGEKWVHYQPDLESGQG